jgi:hypothetical protein
MEEIVHRDRIRKWHYHTLEMLSIVASSSGSKAIFEKVGEKLDLLYRMEIHAPGAYDLNKQATDTNQLEKSDQEIFNLLDKIPNA